MSEYYGVHNTVGILQRILNILDSLGFDYDTPMVLADNQSAITMATSDGMTDMALKIMTKYHEIRQWVKEKRFCNVIFHVGTNDNVADIKTKPLGRVKFSKFADQMLDPGEFLNWDEIVLTDMKLMRAEMTRIAQIKAKDEKSKTKKKRKSNVAPHEDNLGLTGSGKVRFISELVSPVSHEVSELSNQEFCTEKEIQKLAI